MNIETQIQIRKNPYLYHYLRENTSWYKVLNRYPEAIKNLEQEAKDYYHLNPSDKIDQISKKVEMIRTFMDMIN